MSPKPPSLHQNGLTNISVYLIGPESTGKTTLFRALVTRLALPAQRTVPEVARALMQTQGWTGHDTGVLSRQMAIATATLEAEERAATSNKGVVADRNALCCCVYLKRLSTLGDNTWHEIARELDVRGALSRYRKGLVVLFEPVEGWWTSDGLRRENVDTEELWQIFEDYREVLRYVQVDFVRLSGQIRSTEERLGKVLEMMGNFEGQKEVVGE